MDMKAESFPGPQFGSGSITTHMYDFGQVT